MIGPLVIVHDQSCATFILFASFPMATIERRITSPASLEEAQSIVELLLANLGRNFEIVRGSLSSWDQQGCHYLAQALKSCYYYDHGNVLGTSLRSLAGTAIIVEHRLATKS